MKRRRHRRRSEVTPMVECVTRVRFSTACLPLARLPRSAIVLVRGRLLLCCMGAKTAVCCGESTVLLSCLERVPTSRLRDWWPLRIREAPVRLVEALCLLAIACGRNGHGRRILCAVLIELVVFAPVVAIVGVLLRFDPFLGLHAVHIGLERGWLPSLEDVLRLGVTGRVDGQLQNVGKISATYSGDRVESPWNRYGPDIAENERYECLCTTPREQAPMR